MVERKRHLAKAVSYRLLGSLGTAAIAVVATGDVHLGASIGLLDSVVKVGLYYAHERIWYRVRWGVHPVGRIPYRDTEGVSRPKSLMPDTSRGTRPAPGE